MEANLQKTTKKINEKAAKKKGIVSTYRIARLPPSPCEVGADCRD